MRTEPLPNIYRFVRGWPMKCYIFTCIFIAFLTSSVHDISPRQKNKDAPFFIHYVTLALSLQKQICCFDHRVVTMVVVKLWLWDSYYGIIAFGNRKASAGMCKQPGSVHITQPQYTDNPQNICEGIFTNALQSCCNSLTDVSGHYQLAG